MPAQSRRRLRRHATDMPTTFHFSVNATLVDKYAQLLIWRKKPALFGRAAPFLRHRATRV
jgi:hypothetical protein